MDPYYKPRAGKVPNLEFKFSQDTTNHGPVTNSYDYSKHTTRFDNFTNNGHYIGTNTGPINHYTDSRPHGVAASEYTHISDHDRLHPMYSSSHYGDMRRPRRGLDHQVPLYDRPVQYPAEDPQGYDVSSLSAQPPPPYYPPGHAQFKRRNPSPYRETKEYRANPTSTAGSHSQKYKGETYWDGRREQDPISYRRLSRSPQPKMKSDRRDYEKDYREMPPQSQHLVYEGVARKKQHKGEVIDVSSESDEDEKLCKKMSKVQLAGGKSARPMKREF